MAKEKIIVEIHDKDSIFHPYEVQIHEPETGIIAGKLFEYLHQAEDYVDKLDEHFVIIKRKYFLEIGNYGT